jgi:hypothetical protein
MTDQEIIDLAIEYGAFIIDDDLCGDGMDVMAFTHDIISRLNKQ